MSRRFSQMTQDRIRNASLLDIDALCRLLARAAHEVAAYLSRGHLLVLERRDGALEAVCHVDVGVGRSTIDVLVVDPELADDSVRPRMVGVARALCEAYGYPCAA
jgi:N-acetylglutamate synthase-like GNAT family acetyltransferase